MTFKVGDVVMLTSGGVAMTVGELQADGQVGCLWFDGGALNSVAFQPGCLALVPTDQDIIDEVFGEDQMEGVTRN